MDLVTGVEGVEVLGLIEVPEHGGTVLATGGAEGAVGGDGDGVDVAGVTDVVGLETAGGELPNLYCSSALAHAMHNVCINFLPAKKKFSNVHQACGVFCLMAVVGSEVANT